MTLDPQSSRKTQHSSAHKSASHSNTSQADGFYGHEDTARMSAAFITSLFSCPEVPPPSNNVTPSGAPAPSPKLANFIAYALHRTRLTSSVTYAALYLLQRLKTRFPAARGSSGHRLFISAFMIASKVVCDDTYSNKSWAVVGQGMFSLREINQMEREMCGYLEWQLNIGGDELETFSDEVTERFASSGFFALYSKSKPERTTIIRLADEAAAAEAATRPPTSSSVTGTHSPTLRPTLDTTAAPAPAPATKRHRSSTDVVTSPATVLSSVDEEGVRERNAVADEDEDEDVESPASRSSASSSPESDMVSTPTSMHGEDAPPHARSHHHHHAVGVVAQDASHHHHGLARPPPFGSSASKLPPGGTASAPPPLVKTEARGPVSEAVW